MYSNPIISQVSDMGERSASVNRYMRDFISIRSEKRMILKRMLSLITAFVFLFSTSIPSSGLASDTQTNNEQVSVQKQVGDKLDLEPVHQIWPSFKVSLLSPVIAEMSDAVAVLHPEYPKQLAIWEKLIKELPEESPIRNQMENIIGYAKPLLLSISAYSDVYSKARKDLEEPMAEKKPITEESLAEYHFRLGMLASLQEKLGYFEILSQGFLSRLYNLISEVWSDHPESGFFKEIEAFESLRQTQIAKYFEARKA